MDFDAIADELYGMPPDAFTAARDRYAAAARQAGDRTLAGKLKELRRPTAAAWAGNLLVRHSRDQADALMQLGANLRQAHHELDGAQLRELTRQQHALVATLAQQAVRLAAEAGKRLGDTARREVEATLHAALADPEAARAWSAGRLDKPLTAPVGFPGVSGTATVHPLRPSAPASRGHRTGRAESGKASVSELEAARARRRERERAERIERARHDADQAQAVCRSLQQELDQRQEEADQAEQALQQAAQEIENLKERLEEARAHHREVQDDARQARKRLRDAEQTARKAERRAETALSELEGHQQ